MNCETTQDLLNGYLDGELDLVNHLQIEEHLKTCPSCSLVFENYSAVKSAMADDSLYFKAPPDLRSRIKSALPGNQESTPRARVWLWRWVPALAATAAIVVLMFLFLPLVRQTTICWRRK